MRSAEASGQNTEAAAARRASPDRRSARTSSLRRSSDGRVAHRRWYLNECREPANISGAARTPNTAAGPNLGRASAAEGAASDRTTAPRMGIAHGRMTVLRSGATCQFNQQAWAKVPFGLIGLASGEIAKPNCQCIAVMSASLIGHSGSSAFRLIHHYSVDVAHGLVLL